MLEDAQSQEALYVTVFKQSIESLTSTLPERQLVPHLEYGLHPCFQPVHHKTWHGTLSCPQPKHTVGGRENSDRGEKEMKTCPS